MNDDEQLRTLRDTMLNVQRLFVVLRSADADALADPAPGSPLVEALLPLLLILPEHRPRRPSRN